MANYLALIRKADFIDLYKYGYLHINRDLIRQFTCKIEDLPNREVIFRDLTYYANAFDSTFVYLFIHYEKTIGRDRENDINIADIRGIYPLDDEAKKELSTSLDSRIEIRNPLWPNAVYNLQKWQSIQDCKNGASNIWKIYHLSDSIENINTIVTDDIIKEIIDEVYDNRRPMGELPIWVYIMRYERHAFYPNNTIGAFMDTANVIFNYYKKYEVDSSEIESTIIMQFLQYWNTMKPDMRFDDVLQKMSEEPKISKFIYLSKEIVPNYDLIKIATLFYIYKNKYKGGFIYERDMEKHGIKFNTEFSIACYMLGCILGHEHTYDCLYEQMPLAIFKKKQFEVIQESANKQETYVSANDNCELVKPIEIKSINKGENMVFPCKMGKPKKNGKGFLKNPEPQIINDLDMYLQLEKKGWKIIIGDKELW